MGWWGKAVVSALVVWAVGASLFLAMSTLHQREQDDRLWCLEVGVTTLQVGVGRLAGTVNDNVVSMQGWADLDEIDYRRYTREFPPKRFFYPPDETLLTFTDPSADVLEVCKMREE